MSFYVKILKMILEVLKFQKFLKILKVIVMPTLTITNVDKEKHAFLDKINLAYG